MQSQHIDPEALQALVKMGAYLRTLNSFEVALDTTIDKELDDGEMVQLSGATNYKVRRPSNFAIVMASDRKVRNIYYDGKTLTVYAPRAHYYATVPAPPTIKETLDAAYDKYGIELPMEDLFRWGTPEDKRTDLRSGKLIGYAKIDGKDTDQYAFRQGDVDWQIWIQRGDKPLPLKAVITTTSDPSKPQFSSALHWVFANPQFHHWHHCNEPSAYNANFAPHFVIFDLLFGTAYIAPAHSMPSQYGLVERVPEGFLRQMIHPFAPIRSDTSPARSPRRIGPEPANAG